MIKHAISSYGKNLLRRFSYELIQKRFFPIIFNVIKYFIMKPNLILSPLGGGKIKFLQAVLVFKIQR